MPRFRSQPSEVEAVQLCWRNWSEVCDFLGDVIGSHNPGRMVPFAADTCGEPGPEYIEITVVTAQGKAVPVSHGEWIVKEPWDHPGRFYPIDPAIFAAKYEEI